MRRNREQPLPGMAARKPPSLLVQLFDLLLMELTNWRWSWRSMVVVGTLGPLFSMLALGVFASASGPSTLAYVMTGNLVLALMFGNLGNVCNRFSFMRFMGGLDYYATLPIRKPGLILASVLSFLILSLPSFVITAVVGSLVLHIPLSPSPLLLIVIPCCAIPLSGIGALIGVTARSPQEANSLSLLFTLVLTAVGPVIIPPDRLPPLMLAIGLFSPATYAASALRQTLLGPVTPVLFVDIAVLGLTAVVLFALVGRLLDWRQVS